MNRQGFTLIELLIAGALLVTTIACFGGLLKTSARHLASAESYSRALYAARTKMETLRRLPVAAELSVIQVEVKWDPQRPLLRLVSLRSKYQ